MVAEIGRAANKMIQISFSRVAFALAACSAAIVGFSTARAADFSAEYVFGDSLSDNGNLAAAGWRAFPDPPSFDNSFTNGPVAVQLLAQSLGLSANASLWLTSPSPQGTNYAVGGATAAARRSVRSSQHQPAVSRSQPTAHPYRTTQIRTPSMWS